MRKVYVAICLLLLAGMIGWKMSESWREEQKQNGLIKNTSDASKIDHYVKVAGDEWLGYLIFRSPVFRGALEEKGIALQFVNEPDFRKRFAMLESGECDMVCATIDSYLVNGKSSNYPGVIVFGIDESHGGDAIVARDPIANLDDLKEADVKGAFVGYSPSEFLLKSQIAHFGITNLTDGIRDFRTDDASDAYQKLDNGEVEFAVLWEPFVAKAVREIEGANILIDTREARGLVYDVAIASRTLVAEKPSVVKTVSNLYFDTLNKYLSKPASFKELAETDSGESRADAETMLGGIRFLNLTDNREMMKVSGDFRFSDAVTNITKILVEVGDLPSDPLNGNPRLIINSGFLDTSTGAASQLGAGNGKSMKRFYRSLSESEWQSLNEKRSGTLLEEPVTFGVGQSTIPDEFQEQLKTASEKLVHYPGHRVIVEAHVSPGSDPALDRSLSQERADVIREFLTNEAGVVSDRIYAVGVGGDEPVVREKSEGMRAWKRRCRRARIYLVKEY